MSFYSVPIWTLTKTYEWTYWLIWGSPVTVEQKILEQQNARLTEMERQLAYLVQISRADPTLTTHDDDKEFVRIDSTPAKK